MQAGACVVPPDMGGITAPRSADQRIDAGQYGPAIRTDILGHDEAAQAQQVTPSPRLGHRIEHHGHRHGRIVRHPEEATP